MDLDLDIKTLSIVTVLICSAYGIGILMLQSIQNNIKGLRILAIAVFVIAVGFFTLSFGNSTSLWFSKVFANSFICLGFTLFVSSLLRFRCSPSLPEKLTLFFYPVLVFCLIYFTDFENSTNARIIAVSLYIAFCSFCAAYVVKEGKNDDHPLAIALLIAAFMILALWMLARVYITYMSTQITDFMFASSVHQYSFLAMILLILTLGFTFPWMINARLIANIYQTSLRDTLTNIYNRRALEEMIPRELSRAQRLRTPFSVIILDLDHFKKINDRYGHQIGDVTLAGIGHLLTTQIRKQDISFRIGGEEFLVVLPDTTIESAHIVAEKLRQKVAEQRFTPKQQEPWTASFGVAQLLDNDEWDELLKRADAALYLAKRKGRNRVCDVSDI
ncbi:GGDEF domain-containing protein [Vibrio sp. IRLE0018]|uniref:GGDEF domain-containing protein n=1 Tax=Vibrio TaxID=662 RepID=UPI0015941490|nr:MULTISPECIES: GGDEF domain-containing protein [Vibrio]MCF8779312.1 GGDEF domain-containing protein [Vibrio floridensis]NVC63198.1 GGDEF domain-containing protein [Vibrio sp. 05-20-BW147]HAS6347396.1 diguanylate cyclase [Vibrio vulnificus]